MADEFVLELHPDKLEQDSILDNRNQQYTNINCCSCPLAPTSSEDNQPKEVYQPRSSAKQLPAFIGNMSLSTTERNILKTGSTTAASNAIDKKFDENSGKSQPQRHCSDAFALEKSSRLAMEKLPKKTLHGPNSVVSTWRKRGLRNFELNSSKENQRKRRKHSDMGEHSQDINCKIEYPSRQERTASPAVSALQQGSSFRYKEDILHSSSYGLNNIASTSSYPLTTNMEISTSTPPPILTQDSPPRKRELTLDAEYSSLLTYQHRSNRKRHNSVRSADFHSPSGSNCGPGVSEWEAIIGTKPPVSSVNRSFLVSRENNKYANERRVPSSVLFDRRSCPLDNQCHEEGMVPSNRINGTIGGVNVTEFDEIMELNRRVTRSAIARAVDDAAAGDYSGAIATLVEAVSLISGCKIGNDDRCQIIISSLQDALRSIESKFYGPRWKQHHVLSYGHRRKELLRKKKFTRPNRSRNREHRHSERLSESDLHQDCPYRVEKRYLQHSRRRERRISQGRF